VTRKKVSKEDVTELAVARYFWNKVSKLEREVDELHTVMSAIRWCDGKSDWFPQSSMKYAREYLKAALGPLNRIARKAGKV